MLRVHIHMHDGNCRRARGSSLGAGQGNEGRHCNENCEEEKGTAYNFAGCEGGAGQWTHGVLRIWIERWIAWHGRCPSVKRCDGASGKTFLGGFHSAKT